MPCVQHVGQTIYRLGPGPKLATLIESGMAWLDRSGYMVKASDGVIVQIASVYDAPSEVESYLTDHPSPNTW